MLYAFILYFCMYIRKILENFIRDFRDLLEILEILLFNYCYFLNNSLWALSTLFLLIFIN